MGKEDGARFSPETCRAKAEECRLLAKQAKQPAHRIMLLHMAETWERIAATYQSGNN
jgi:hypothetical protein